MDAQKLINEFGADAVKSALIKLLDEDPRLAERISRELEPEPVYFVNAWWDSTMSGETRLYVVDDGKPVVTSDTRKRPMFAFQSFDLARDFVRAAQDDGRIHKGMTVTITPQ